MASVGVALDLHRGRDCNAYPASDVDFDFWGGLVMSGFDWREWSDILLAFGVWIAGSLAIATATHAAATYLNGG